MEREILSAFGVVGKCKIKKIKKGNINNTFFVISDNKYVFQRINKGVFLFPDKLMQNIENVCAYLDKKGLIGRNFKLKNLKMKYTFDGRAFFVDKNGEYWRCFYFVKNSVTLNKTENLKVIKNVGRAFGVWEKSLINFPTEKLYPSIPDFHDTKKRYLVFIDAVNRGGKRRDKAKDEIKKLLSFRCLSEVLIDRAERGDIPFRVTHNDTKINNVCLNKKNRKPIAVLDLDTVMKGLIAYDFGDGARSIAVTRFEESRRKPEFDLQKFKAFTCGFVKEIKTVLTEEEKKWMYLGVFTVTVELALRFLTDYLDGDKYFKIRYRENNLNRAKNQIALAEDILLKEKQIREIVDKYL